MKYTIVSALLLFATIANAQTMDSTAKKTDIVAQKVIGYFKAQHPDSAYALTGKSFQDKISSESFTSIFTGQILPLNNFENVSFVSSTDGINKYKISGTPDLELLIGLDEIGKVETLLVKPYTE